MSEPMKGNIEAVAFAKEAAVQLYDLLTTSGKVLYSSAATLKPGDMYLLGINPGGESGADGTTTIGENLFLFPTKTSNDYLDEEWPSRSRRLQDHVISLINRLDHDVREVCASNMVFTRSPTEPPYREFKRLANICWPVHLRVISVVRPRLVIVFGLSPFYYLWERAGKPEKEERLSGNYNRGTPTYCKSFRAQFADHETVIVGIPHLSGSDAAPETIQFIRNR